MNPTANSAPQSALLIRTDISGDARKMTAIAKTFAHSRGIFAELIHAIIHQIELPLAVAGLEGDVVFFFLPEGKRREVVARGSAYHWRKTAHFFSRVWRESR